MFKKIKPYIPWLVALAVSIYVPYDIHKKSQKISDFKITQHSPSDVFLFVGKEFRRNRIKLTVDNNLVDSMYIFNLTATNKGNVPVLPGDFIEPISFSVDNPWKVIYIGSQFPATENTPNVRWEQLDEQSYKMIPCLFNPKDYYFFSIYIIRDAKDSPKELNKEDKIPEMRWKGRIVNVKSFFHKQTLNDYLPTYSIYKSPLRFFQTRIELVGWEIYWFLLLSCTLFMIGVLVSGHSNRLSVKGWLEILLLTLIMIFSMATGEIVVFILTPQYLPLWPGCWILLGLHIVFFIYIAYPSVRDKMVSQKA